MIRYPKSRINAFIGWNCNATTIFIFCHEWNTDSTTSKFYYIHAGNESQYDTKEIFKCHVWGRMKNVKRYSSIHIQWNCTKPECPEGSRDKVTNGSCTTLQSITMIRPWNKKLRIYIFKMNLQFSTENWPYYLTN